MKIHYLEDYLSYLCGLHVNGLGRELFHAVLKECVISEICLLFTKILLSFLAREFF